MLNEDFLLLYLFYGFAGVAYGDAVVGYIVNYYAACSDGYVVADCYAWQDCNATTNPYVIAYGDRFGLFVFLVAMLWVDWVTYGVDAYVGRNEAVVAYGDFGFVEHYEIEV